jgi:O-antigen/teichoic acid export membrane protein
MGRLGRYRTDLFIVVGFLILPFLLFGTVTLGSKTMLPVDNLFQWAPWQSAAEQFNATVPHNSLLTDLIIENYAWKRFAVNSIQQGEIPLWNPYLFAGVPFLAAGQHAMLYPFSWIFFFLSPVKAYGWYTVLQLWLAALSMYFFGRTLTMRRGSAALAGLIYQGSGFLLVSAAVFPMIIGAAVWLPMLLACIEKVVASSTRRTGKTMLWMGMGAIVLGLQILAGHIEITYYTLLIMAIYALWRLVAVAIDAYHRGQNVEDTEMLEDSQVQKASWGWAVIRPSAWLLALVTIGLMLGSLQLVPLYEIGQANFREGSASFAEVRSWAFPPRRILTLALPNFFGNPAHHTYVDAFTGETVSFELNSAGELNPQGEYSSNWGIKNYVEGGIYLGILPLLMALLGIVSSWQAGKGSKRRMHGLFFFFLGLFSIAFIFGTPLYAILYYGLPFINQLHTPFRWVWPLSLVVAVLAGFGVDAILFCGEERNKNPAMQANVRPDRTITGEVLIGAGILAGSVVLGMLLIVWFFFDRLESQMDRLFQAMALAPSAFSDSKAFFSYEFWQILALGILLLASAFVLLLGIRGRRRAFLLLAALLIIGDLFLANRGFNAAADPALLDYKPSLVTWLEAQPGQWRLTSFTPHGDKPFNANSAWLFDLQDVRGYDSIIPKQYTEYMAAIESQNELPFNRVQPIGNWESLNSPLLDVLGVRYIISSEPFELPKLKQVWEGEGVFVYENLAAAPRAYILPVTATAVVDDVLAAMVELDPRQYVVVEGNDFPADRGTVVAEPEAAAFAAAAVTEYRNIQVTVDAQLQEPSWLLLNDSYFPGWKAFVRPLGSSEDQEVEQPIIRVNGNFRGVQLEPGEWTVRFRYSPASFQLGGLASAMGLIILLFATAVWGWRRLYRPQPTLTAAASIAKNSGLPMALNLFNRAIDFVFAMYYLRVLGPYDAGRYVAAITTAGFFEILANYGLDMLLIRDVSQDKSRANHYLFNTTLLRLGAGLVASIPILVFMWSTNYSENPLTTAEVVAIILIMVGMVFSGMSKGVTGLFYVYEEAEIPAGMTTATTILKVGLGVVVLLLGYSFVGLAAVSIVVNIITLAVLIVLAVRHFGLAGPWRLDWGLQQSLIHKGFPLMLIHLLQTIFISIDILLLRLMLDNGEEVVGWYQNAYKWFNALQVIPAFFTLALFPIISREIEKAMDSARRMYTMSLKLMLLLALPIAAYTTFLAYFLVRLLAGQQYLPNGAIALQIVIWSIPFGWLNSVTNYVLIALGLERIQPRAFAIAVGFNIVANILLIPRYSFVAASVTTILSEVVLLAVFAFYLKQRMHGVKWLSLMWRPWVVTVVMVGTMWLGSQIHLVVALVVGALVYPAGLLLLRVVGDEERKVLAAILPEPIARRLHLG